MDCSGFFRARRCACGNIRRTTRSLTQFYDRHLLSCGLRVSQFSLLLNISLSGQTTVGALAELLSMDQTTVSRNLEALKRAGYVDLARESHDARKRLLSLTPAGQAKLAEALPLWEAAQAHIEAGVGKERLRDFLKLLTEINSLTR
jgi:DNA-binding MarR family transcriptional regulator